MILWFPSNGEPLAAVLWSYSLATAASQAQAAFPRLEREAAIALLTYSLLSSAAPHCYTVPISFALACSWNTDSISRTHCCSSCEPSQWGPGFFDKIPFLAMYYDSNYSNGTAPGTGGGGRPAASATPTWTPDPVIGHLLNTMRRVGPRRAPGGGGYAPNSSDLDPEEEFEFLEQLLQSKELNALVKAHNVILFCNQVRTVHVIGSWCAN